MTFLETPVFMLSRPYTLQIRGINLGGLWSRPPDFGQGDRGDRRGSRNIIISYHVQEVCSKVMTFEEKYNNLLRSSFKWPIFAWKIENFLIAWKNWNFLKIYLKKIDFLWNCLKKLKFFWNLPEKIEMFGPWSTTPDFKPDWRCRIKL